MATPSERAKAAGLDSLAEMAKLSDVSQRTLINWHKDYPKRFTAMLAGCVVVKRTTAA